MLRIARDRPFPSAKLSKHLEYRRAIDEDKVHDAINGWSFALLYIIGGGAGMIMLAVKMLFK